MALPDFMGMMDGGDALTSLVGGNSSILGSLFGKKKETPQPQQPQSQLAPPGVESSKVPEQQGGSIWEILGKAGLSAAGTALGGPLGGMAGSALSGLLFKK